MSKYQALIDALNGDNSLFSNVRNGDVRALLADLERAEKALQDVPVVSDEQIRTTVESIQDPGTVAAFHNGYYTLTPDELRRAILAMRPAVEPMTPEQREVLAALVVGACEHKTRTLLALRAIEATEAQYGIGITAKAEDAHQPTKEAE